jgi:hypothetical protein
MSDRPPRSLVWKLDCTEVQDHTYKSHRLLRARQNVHARETRFIGVTLFTSAIALARFASGMQEQGIIRPFGNGVRVTMIGNVRGTNVETFSSSSFTVADLKLGKTDVISV